MFLSGAGRDLVETVENTFSVRVLCHGKALLQQGLSDFLPWELYNKSQAGAVSHETCPEVEEWRK